ncbi:ADP-ribosylation factor [Mycena rebaudengoi]|nr:ADP-ribosylation factor [Mycena rebaudengoi]
MSAIIRRLIECFSSGQEYRVIFLGLDASGKTTLLYRMKLGAYRACHWQLDSKSNIPHPGEIVQTIPTIGFNVESVQLRARMGTTDRILKVDCWDVGSVCGRPMWGLLKHFLAPSDAIVWLIDSSDRERLSESVEGFSTAMRSLAEDTTLDVEPKDRPVLMRVVFLFYLATKQDFPKAMSIDEIRLKVNPALSGRRSFAVGISLNQSLTEGALPEAFGWLLMALENPRSLPASGTSSISTSSSTLKPKTADPTNPAATTLEEKLSAWLRRTETDSPPEEFLRQFAELQLPAWDHYTHIRIAYLLLTKSGRQKGKDMVFEGIEKYIAQSSQTRGRTFHVTMTYFWIQMVHFGIRSTPDVDSVVEKLAESEEFMRFLLLNPFVTDGGLWAQYYSKDVMMSVKAKAEMVLPDKKALPNLVVRDAINRV